MRTRLTTLLAGLGLLAAGCGGSGDEPQHKVQGRLTRDGAPLKVTLPEKTPPGDPGLQVGLAEDKPGGVVHPAKVDVPNASFTIPGPRGQGVPAGKYRLYVVVGLRGTVSDDQNPLSQKRTPLRVEVPGTGELVVEVGKTPSAKWQ